MLHLLKEVDKHLNRKRSDFKFSDSEGGWIPNLRAELAKSQRNMSSTLLTDGILTGISLLLERAWKHRNTTTKFSILYLFL